jgi:hypothetical protein
MRAAAHFAESNHRIESVKVGHNGLVFSGVAEKYTQQGNGSDWILVTISTNCRQRDAALTAPGGRAQFGFPMDSGTVLADSRRFRPS